MEPELVIVQLQSYLIRNLLKLQMSLVLQGPF